MYGLKLADPKKQKNKKPSIKCITFLSDCWLVMLFTRFPAGQQLKLVTAPMACGAVMVPTSMFMGQVVTAYNPFGGQQVGTSQTG